MPKISRKWIKRLLIGGALAMLLPLAAIGALVLFIVILFRSAPEGANLGLLVQDCPGISVTVSGEVRDPSGQPISGAHIEMRESSFDPDSESEMRFTTNDAGVFQTDEPLWIFLCDNLYFDVSAGGVGLYRGGFERIRITYSLADNYWEEYFPEQPIPVRLIITLVEKLEITDEPDLSA
jgi:hypothetical protein